MMSEDVRPEGCICELYSDISQIVRIYEPSLDTRCCTTYRGGQKLSRRSYTIKEFLPVLDARRPWLAVKSIKCK